MYIPLSPILLEASPMARQQKPSEKTDFLWKQYFKDPSMWYDHRNNKNSFGSPDFRHTIRYESLWIHGWHNPSWILVEMQRRASSNEDTTEIHENEFLCRNHKNDFAFLFVAMLKDCAKKKDICKGSRLHAHILKKGLLEKSPYLASSLINMYAKCGMLINAQKILRDISIRDVVCWNALITGYVEQRQFQKAVDCMKSMVSEGISPNVVTFICILKACGNMGNVENGRQIHEDIVSRGLLEEDIMLGTALVDMYAKCGALAKAQEVLEGLPVRNIVSWNALIAGYAQQGQCYAAWNCFKHMLRDGLSPDIVTFICILKACGSARDLERGEQVHEKIVTMGWLEKDIVLGNALIDMYAKCGALVKAQQVLQDLPMRNVVSWNTLIGGYAHHVHCHGALSCFEWMQREGQSPDEITFICTLKACGIIGSIDKCKQIHYEITSRALLKEDIVLGNALVDAYSKCGELKMAQEVLDELPCRDVVSWNALIAGYAQQEQGHYVLDCFQRMQIEGLPPDAITFISILKACGSRRDIDEGKQIHEKILNTGFLNEDIVLGNTLVDMYAKCGVLLRAQQILEELPSRNIVSWSALIAGYAQQGQAHEALNCFECMQREGFSPDEVTLISILKACGNIGAIEKGIEIHDKLVSRGLLDKDIMLGTALLDMYVKCGVLTKAQQVLEELPVRNVVSWSALIAGRVQRGQGHEALHSFEQMQNEGLSPNVVTFFCILKACGSTGNIEKGKQIHEAIMNRGMLIEDVVLGDALVDMYVKCGVLDKAQQVLEELPVRKVVSWNALISGYTQQGQCHEALNCLQWMQTEGLAPNVVTFVCILKACGRMGAIDKGKQVYYDLVTKGLMEKHIVFGNALVDMYAKCGAVAKARRVLEDLPLRNIVSWNALIAGYAQQGQGHEALTCFEQMQSEGLYPDDITFLCVLSACTHSGLLDEAQMIFASMTRRFGVTPNVKHHTCMVIIFGYAGQFDEAISVIKVMPCSDYLAVWLALLAACSKWGNVNLGRLAFDQAIQLEDGCGAAYVLMASTFAAAGMQEEAAKVEAMRLIYAD